MKKYIIAGVYMLTLPVCRSQGAIGNSELLWCTMTNKLIKPRYHVCGDVRVVTSIQRRREQIM